MPSFYCLQQHYNSRQAGRERAEVASWRAAGREREGEGEGGGGVREGEGLPEMAAAAVGLMAAAGQRLGCGWGRGLVSAPRRLLWGARRYRLVGEPAAGGCRARGCVVGNSWG